MVIPSEVEGSRGETLKVAWRDPSTLFAPLRMTEGICAMFLLPLGRTRTNLCDDEQMRGPSAPGARDDRKCVRDILCVRDA